MEEFLNNNKRGLIPGPNESEEAFVERVDYCLGLKDRLKNAAKDQLPFCPDEAALDLSEKDLGSAEACYGISPDWVPVFFSNAQLTPWHGGCAWIFQMDTASPLSAFLQLRRTFQYADTYLGILHKKEVLTHELAHVGRMCFEEPKFEEFLAYRSSSSSWRRWLGPLVQSAQESLLFVFLLVMILFVDLFLFWQADFSAYQRFMWLKMIPLGLVFAGLIRLIFRHRQLRRCAQALEAILPDPTVLDAVIYRLTDEEIIAFSAMDAQELLHYIHEMAKNSLRWRVIARSYFQ